MGTYQNLLSQAQNVYNSNPYTPIVQGTAPVNAQQYAGIGGVNQYANAAQPAISTAEQMATAAASPITASQIQQYESPYTQDVVNATQAQFNNQNQQQLQGVKGNAAAQGALGGNREAVAEAETTNQQQLAQAPVIANLQNQGYQTGLNTALTEQQALASGAYGLGNLGVAGQTAGLSGAGAQIGAGSLEQNTQQQALNALYTQQMQQQAFPYQQLQWLSGIDTGVGSQMGGTSSTTGPPPNAFNQWLGLGTLGASTLGSTGMFGSGAAGGALAGLLASGGAVKGYDSGGGVAHNRGEITTIPESRDTLRAQQKHLVSGHRRAQLFPRGTSELDLPRGMSKTQTHLGSVHYNPDKISGDHVRHLVANNKANELLDLGPVTKEEALHRVNHMGEHPVAVVERQPDGTEVRAASGSHVTAPYQLHHMERTKVPGNHVRLEHPANVIAHRLNRSSGGYVPGFDGGGGVAGTPYSGVAGWIPSIQLTHGSGAPKPPSAPSQQNNLADQMKSINAITSSLTGKGNNQPTTKPQQQPDNTTNPVPQGFGTTTGLNYDASGNPIPTLDAGIVGPVMDSYRGGVVHGYADGGTPDFGLDDPDFSDFSPSGVMYDTQQGIPADSKKDSSGYLIPDGANPDGAWNNLPDSGVLPVGYKGQDSERIKGRDLNDDIGITDLNLGITPSGIVKTPIDSVTPSADTSKYGVLHNTQGDSFVGTSQPPEGLNHNNLIKSMGYPTGFTDPSLGIVRKSNPPPQRGNDDVQLASYKDGDVTTSGVSGHHDSQSGNNGWRMYMPDPNNPQNQQKTTSSGGIDLSANSKLWPALMAAGAGMLSSASPFRGVGLGQGATAGIEAYNNQVKQEKSEKLSQAHIDLEGQKLFQAQQRAQEEYDLKAATPHVMGQVEDALGNKKNIYGVFDKESGRVLPVNTGHQENQSPIGRPIVNPTGPQTISAEGPSTTTGGPAYDKNGTPTFVNPTDGKTVQVTTPVTGPAPEDSSEFTGANKPAEWKGNETPIDQVRPAPPKSFIDENGIPHGDMFLKELTKSDPGLASVVKQIDEGRQLPPTGMMLRTPYGQKLQQAVAQYDPDFDAANAKTRAGTLAKFKYGKGADALTSFNTSIQHLGELRKAVEDLNNWNNLPQISNWLRGGAQGQLPAVFGDGYQKAVAKFNASRTAVTDELTRAFRLSGGNVHDIKAWEKNLDPYGAKTSQITTIEEAVHLLDGRIESVGNEFNRGMHLSRDPISLLSPKAKETVDALREGKVPGITVNTKPTESFPPKDQREVGKIYTAPNGNQAKWTGTGWESVQ